MDIQNLWDYVRWWAFLEDIEGLPFDAILWEKIPWEISKKTKNTKGEMIDHEIFGNLGYDVRPQGSIINWIKNYKHVLIILDVLDTTSIASFLPALPVSTIVTIWNIGPAITWIINKHTIDSHDIETIDAYFTIYEPIDFYHFHFLTKLETNAYIRISQDEVPNKIFDEAHEKLYTQQLISFQEFGYTGTKWLVLTLPSVLPAVSQALQYLQTQQGLGYDLSVIPIIGETLSSQAESDLLHADDIFLIHDQENNVAFEHWVSTIMKQGSHYGKIRYYHPDYAKLTTNIPWYIHTQASFDAEAIAKWIHSYI